MVISVLLAVAIQASSFDLAANEFIGCLRATVQMGMTTRMDPEQFRASFANACRDEEARFRTAAIRETVAQGRSEANAAAEVDTNIANGRRIFAADQESYVRSGQVPR